MIEHWTQKYLMVPFRKCGRDFSGCDCGGLVLLALRLEKGVQATDFRTYEEQDFRGKAGRQHIAYGIADLINREWPLVTEPQPFDLCRFRYGRDMSHVGLYVGCEGFLHVAENEGYSRLVPWSDIHWKQSFVDFRRHVSLTEKCHD